MAFSATIELVDSFNRKTAKHIETTAATLADAVTAIGLYCTDLAAISDLACVKVAYLSDSTAEAFAGEADSNVDVGATFRVLLNNGKYAAHHVPGFPLSLVGGDGAIDCTAQAVVDYFANFLTGAACRLSEGNYVVSVISGHLDR